MSGLWRVPCRLVGLFILVACLIVPWPLIMTLPRVKGQHIQRWLFKNICRLFHITINITGRPETRTGVLYVANHTSYLDIIVLGSFLPDCSFIAKGDMSRWPIINLLCNIPRSIFVKRQADEAAKQKNILNTRLAEGDRLVLFAEGTTTLGHRVLPFKSSLFAAPIELAKQHQEILVQPITILPTHKNGLPMEYHEKHIYAWLGDLSLAQHVGPLLRNNQITVSVIFHDPLSNMAVAKRRQLSDYCHAAVEAGTQRLLAAQAPEQRALPPPARG